jgi:hypothetical protein
MDHLDRPGPERRNWFPSWLANADSVKALVQHPEAAPPSVSRDFPPGPHLDRTLDQGSTPVLDHAITESAPYRNAVAVLGDVEAYCRRLFASDQWQEAWKRRHNHPTGHEAARRGVEACLDAARQCLKRGDVATVHAVAALARRVADGIEWESVSTTTRNADLKGT